MMETEELSSLSLHLDYPPGAVVSVQSFTDKSAGIYPVYYLQKDDTVLVCTSVLPLIRTLGDFKPDEEFLDSATSANSAPSRRQIMMRTLLSQIPISLQKTVKPLGEPVLAKLGLISTGRSWVDSTRTPDRRISKVHPFESITPNNSEMQFEPTFSVDPRETAQDVAEYMTQFINYIESTYPDHHHIVLTGGKDSQLIWLVDKENPEQWHAASSPPNYSLNEKFLEENSIPHKSIIKLSQENRESAQETQQKILASDLRSDIRHLRWRPRQKELAEQYNQQVIFWSGTVGDTLHSYHPDYFGAGRENYYTAQFSRAANWQANAHQTVKNYSGCAKLSPYHSPSIWDRVYRHYDPDYIESDDDFRDRIANYLWDHEISWPLTNPSPAPYQYSGVEPKPIYLNFASDIVNAEKDKPIFTDTGISI